MNQFTTNKKVKLFQDKNTGSTFVCYPVIFMGDNSFKNK